MRLLWRIKIRTFNTGRWFTIRKLARIQITPPMGLIITKTIRNNTTTLTFNTCTNKSNTTCKTRNNLRRKRRSTSTTPALFCVGPLTNKTKTTRRTTTTGKHKLKLKLKRRRRRAMLNCARRPIRDPTRTSLSRNTNSICSTEINNNNNNNN